MIKQEVFERLKHCLEVCKLNVNDSDRITVGELMAYSVGIAMIKQMLCISHKGGINNYGYPSGDVLEKAFDGCTYSVNANNVLFSNYNPETIGKLCDDWFGVWNHIDLSPAGDTSTQFLNRLLSGELNWMNFEKLNLRWEMLDSLQEVN